MEEGRLNRLTVSCNPLELVRRILMLVRRFVERSVDLVELYGVAKKKAVTMAASAVHSRLFSFLSKNAEMFKFEVPSLTVGTLDSLMVSFV
jgi:hypothetical protein